MSFSGPSELESISTNSDVEEVRTSVLVVSNDTVYQHTDGTIASDYLSIVTNSSIEIKGKLTTDK